jgi:microcystin-dependent protein
MGWAFFNSEGAERVVADTTIPSATIWMTASAVAAAGWLMCDGSEVAIASYPELFNAIGTTYNSNGSAPAPAVGNFRIPDFRAHHPVGAGTAQTGTPAAGNSYLLGVKAGTKDHTHPVTVNAHTHTMAHTHDYTHTHNMAHEHSYTHTHNLQNHVHGNSHNHVVPSVAGINSGGVALIRPDIIAGALDGANGANGYPNGSAELGGNVGVPSIQNVQNAWPTANEATRGMEIWYFRTSEPRSNNQGSASNPNTQNNTTTPATTNQSSTVTTGQNNNTTSGQSSVNTGAASTSTTSTANVATGTATVIANIPPVLPINFMIKV